MAVGYAAILSLLVTALTMTSYHYSSRNRASSSASNGRNLTVYAMGVGHGDGNIILCPNGRDILIVDMGVRLSQYTKKTYGGYLLKEKFKVVEKQMNIHIVITHPDADHYNFLPESFDELLDQVQAIVIGGKYEEYMEKKVFRDWDKMAGNSMPPIYMVNNGLECFGNMDCKWTNIRAHKSATASVSEAASDDPWQFCGEDVKITVLGANICGKHKKVTGECSNKDPNPRSIVMKLEYKDWSLFLSGDFEGVSQQEKLIANWSRNPSMSMLQSTYYKVAHHGAWTSGKQANLEELLKMVRPKRAYISQQHPILGYNHPKCEVIDHLTELGSIEKVSRCGSGVVCYEKLPESMGHLHIKWNYAIYETCREYDRTSNHQICHDIMITTDGFYDHTSYVDIPADYISKTTSKVDEDTLKYLAGIEDELKNCS